LANAERASSRLWRGPRGSLALTARADAQQVHGKAAEITGRIAQTKQQIEEATSDYDKEKLQQRMAKLAGGVALIRVQKSLDKIEAVNEDQAIGEYGDLVDMGILDPTKVTRTARPARAGSRCTRAWRLHPASAPGSSACAATSAALRWRRIVWR